MSLANTIYDIYLVEFFERINTITLVNASNLALLQLSHKKFTPTEHKQSEDSELVNTSGDQININITEELSAAYPDVLNILQLAQGKISICGLSMINILDLQTDHISCLDIYFHSCSEIEIRDLLIMCIAIMQSSESKRFIHYLKEKNVVIVSNRCFREVRFHCNIFKNREEILGTFENSVERHGWDPVIGYFATLPAAMFYSLRATAITPNYSSTSLYNYELANILILTNGEISRIVSVGAGGCYYMCIYNYIIGKSIGYIEHQYNNKQSIYSKYNILEVKFTTAVPLPIVSIQEAYGKNYIPITIGINNNKYVALANCMRHFGINRDLFRLLCYYWLKAEVNLAKQRLLTGDY